MYKEYIERGALLNEIEEIRPMNWTDTEAEITEQLDYDIFENLVISHPTADVQEIVRCKDCQYFDEATVNEKGFLICPASEMEITEYDFCSYGAKMDKE